MLLLFWHTQQQSELVSAADVGDVLAALVAEPAAAYVDAALADGEVAAAVAAALADGEVADDGDAAPVVVAAAPAAAVAEFVVVVAVAGNVGGGCVGVELQYVVVNVVDNAEAVGITNCFLTGPPYVAAAAGAAGAEAETGENDGNQSVDSEEWLANEDVAKDMGGALNAEMGKTCLKSLLLLKYQV